MEQFFERIEQRIERQRWEIARRYARLFGGTPEEHYSRLKEIEERAYGLTTGAIMGGVKLKHNPPGQVSNAAAKAGATASRTRMATKTGKAALEAAKKAAGRPRGMWTKEASEKWIDVYNRRIEQAARRTELMKKQFAWEKIWGPISTLSLLGFMTEEIAQMFSFRAGAARQEALNKAKAEQMERWMAFKKAEGERFEQYMRMKQQQMAMQQFPRQFAPQLTFEQQMWLQRMRDEARAARGREAAAHERAMLREASQWQDWERARQAQRAWLLQQQRGQIEAAMQAARFQGERELEALRQWGKQTIERLSADLEARNQFIRDTRRHTQTLREMLVEYTHRSGLLTQRHMQEMMEMKTKAALQDEVNRRAAQYEIIRNQIAEHLRAAREQAKILTALRAEADLERLRAIRRMLIQQRAELAQAWRDFRRARINMFRAAGRGEPGVYFAPNPFSPIPDMVVVSVQPRQVTETKRYTRRRG